MIYQIPLRAPICEKCIVAFWNNIEAAAEATRLAPHSVMPAKRASPYYHEYITSHRNAAICSGRNHGAGTRGRVGTGRTRTLRAERRPYSEEALALPDFTTPVDVGQRIFSSRRLVNSNARRMFASGSDSSAHRRDKPLVHVVKLVPRVVAIELV